MMAAIPYTRVGGARTIVQPVASPIKLARNSTSPLIPICCIGFVLFLIAATIILSLIPIYLRSRGSVINSNNNSNNNSMATVSLLVLYRLNNGTLVAGALNANNCAVIQQDQRNLATSNNSVAPSVPTVIQCTVTGNTTRRRRQSQVPEGNLIALNEVLNGSVDCLAGDCLQTRVQNFQALLLARGTFFLTLAGTNGTQFVFSLTVISVAVTPSSASSALSTTTFSSTTTNSSTTTISSTNSTSENITAADNDIAILNYALTLEHLEANFYTTFQANFTAQDFINAGFTQQTYDYFNIIYVHELAHVRALTAIITQLNGTAVPECVYNFTAVTDVQSYITTARALENTGTMAYDGAANGIADTTLRQIAATVATVEARHASYLNSLENLSPFPTPFENATDPSVIIAAIQAFIVSCPYTITAPTVPYVGSSSFNSTVPVSNNTDNSSYTSAMYINDLKVLNYALVAEHLEANFYNTYVSQFSSSNFTSNGFPDATTYFIMIREIENAHVQFLEMIINQRGGTPVVPCTYNFSITSVQDFVSFSSVLENTGVEAYDGAIARLSDSTLILGAATIATVEARFASYLNGLNSTVPFPDITDPTLTPDQVVAILASYQTCSFSPDLPVILNPSSFVLNS